MYKLFVNSAIYYAEFNTDCLVNIFIKFILIIKDYHSHTIFTSEKFINHHDVRLTNRLLQFIETIMGL